MKNSLAHFGVAWRIPAFLADCFALLLYELALHQIEWSFLCFSGFRICQFLADSRDFSLFSSLHFRPASRNFSWFLQYLALCAFRTFSILAFLHFSEAAHLANLFFSSIRPSKLFVLIALSCRWFFVL